MEFIPYSDELKTINTIHKYNNNSYAIIRLTQTMINKNIIDANSFVRELVLRYKSLDFDAMKNGKEGKKLFNAILLTGEKQKEITVSFYKATKRGDPRFSIYGIKKLSELGLLREGDLLYITFSNSKFVFINTTRFDVISEQKIVDIFGDDKLLLALETLLPKLKEIAHKGFVPNSKGEGKIDSKDPGDTLESLLGIATNNRRNADYEGIIELKSKISSRTKDTLFTLRPKFDGTLIESLEPLDRKRVATYTRYYGYDSPKHPNAKSLYVTIGVKEHNQNNQGLYLDIDEDRQRVLLCKDGETTAYWEFSDLEKTLYDKHPATLWVTAEKRMSGNLGEFAYTKAVLTRSPQFMTFISLIAEGAIFYDWRGYSGPYGGKNHGNAWRIKNESRKILFATSEDIDLLK